MHRIRTFDNIPSNGNVCQRQGCAGRARWSAMTEYSKRTVHWRDYCDRHFAEELRKEQVTRIVIRAEQNTSLEVG